jgi:N-acetyltransferase
VIGCSPRRFATVAHVPPALEPVTLHGDHVVLEPVRPEHVDALVAAATVDRSSYAYTTVPGDRAAMEAYVAALISSAAQGTMMPFVQRAIDRRTGRSDIVGCTRFMELRHWRGRDAPDEVEIGGTWLSAPAQRTPINTDAKLLLLSHAFETWNVWRVALVTDARNERSRAAITRLGARYEGMLRNHRPASDTGGEHPRDSAVHSIVPSEWPAIRDRLRRRLGNPT